MIDSYSDMLLVPFAKYLAKYGEWKLSNLGTSMLIPTEKYHFDSIVFIPRRLSFSVDKSWQFIASVNIKEKNQFSKEHVRLFQLLKRFECEVSVKGFFKKKFYLMPNPLLKHLQEEIPDLIYDDHLVHLLEQDESLKRLISIITPESLSITLYSEPINTKNLKEYCTQFREIYQNPNELIWNIKIEKFLGYIISKGKYNRILDSIIEAFENISLHLTNLTARIEREM
ncbi:MAG: hypothetical protein JSV04_12490 [Candidatus Heimdallarchaeota archaeon]|nr:MAG: hypothetical protein JSV04_12490 [Candidatus Heimdallarchaeota archaeon]